MADLDPPHPNDAPFRQDRFVLSPGANALDAYLAESIAALSPVTERKTTMRGMKRLAHVTQTVLTDMDAKADAVADRIVAGQTRAAAVIDKFSGVADAIEATANEVEAALGQFTNDPTQESGGS